MPWWSIKWVPWLLLPRRLVDGCSMSNPMEPCTIWRPKDAALAEAIAQAVYDVDKDLILFAQPGTESIKAAEKIGLLTAAEVFADRSYQEDGTLTPRSKPGAMITDEDASIAQVLSMVLDHKVTCLSGKVIPIKADSICVHGDGPKALLFVQKIRKALAEKGVEIAPAGSFLR